MKENMAGILIMDNLNFVKSETSNVRMQHATRFMFEDDKDATSIAVQVSDTTKAE